MCLIWSDRVTEAMPDDMPEADARQLLAAERAKHAETAQDLQVERAAHDETAEKMVQLQQRLEVTLQELANLERFTKRQQQPNSADAPAPRAATVQTERLMKEEAYLQSRLTFVQKELAEAKGGDGDDGMSI